MDFHTRPPAHVRRLGCFGLAICLALSALVCGGDNGDKTGDGGSTSTTPPPLKSPKRLVWDQQASSVQALRAQTYRLYVDDVLATFDDVRCNESAGAKGYECSGRLPSMSAGAHRLQVSSMLNGVESPRSPTFNVAVEPDRGPER